MKSFARNVMTIKSDNRALIFKYIRPRPISRADIVRQTGMSKSSVTTIVNALIDEGQLVEVGTVESVGQGRHAVLLDIVPDHKYAVGISIDRVYTYAVITDLKFKVIAYVNYRTDKWSDPYELMDHMAREVVRLLEYHMIPISKCVGVGISAPGPVDYKRGMILNPPNFSMFHNVAVADYFEKKLGLPAVVNNNTVLLAMQENALRPQETHRNYIYVLASDGIGSAIMIDDRIHSGSGGLSGELGHTSIHSDGLPCTCGNRGCLENYISMPALREKFGFEYYENVVDDAYLGDTEAIKVLEYVAEEFSCALINAVNLLELDEVIVYGSFSYRSDMLKNMLESRIKERSVITRTHDVIVRFADLTPDLLKASACSAILNRHFEQKL